MPDIGVAIPIGVCMPMGVCIPVTWLDSNRGTRSVGLGHKVRSRFLWGGFPSLTHGQEMK